MRAWRHDKQGDDAVLLEKLSCAACSTDLVTSETMVTTGSGCGSPEVVNVGDEEWYATEVAYKYPRDAEKDGVPVTKMDR